MTTGRLSAAVVCAAAWVLAGGGAPAALRQSAPALGLYAGANAAPLAAEGILPPAPADSSAYEPVPAPGLRSVRNDAQATAAPWVDSNGWRFERGVRRARYDALPAGAGPLAAAEAFAFGVEAIINPDAADLDELRRLVPVLAARGRLPLPALANIGVVDDGSAAMGDVLAMLTRRNLLFRIVPPGDRSLAITMEMGTPAFPRDRLADPGDLAARAREALGDERRLVRVFGTTTVIARLTGDGARARLHLLSYSRTRDQPSIRVRLLGRYQPGAVAMFGAATGAALADVRRPDGTATEFSVPPFSTIAIVDLERLP